MEAHPLDCGIGVVTIALLPGCQIMKNVLNRMRFSPRRMIFGVITNGWEWFSIHFDNGWEMYLSKFNLRTLQDRYAAALIISPNNRNLVEYDKYTLTYTETAQAQEIPSIVYPKKCHLEADRDGIVLKLDIEIYNTYELVWKESRTAMFEGPCRVKGTMSWSGNTVELNGLGMSEITRVRYFLDLFSISR